MMKIIEVLKDVPHICKKGELLYATNGFYYRCGTMEMPGYVDLMCGEYFSNVEVHDDFKHMPGELVLVRNPRFRIKRRAARHIICKIVGYRKVNGLLFYVACNYPGGKGDNGYKNSWKEILFKPEDIIDGIDGYFYISSGGYLMWDWYFRDMPTKGMAPYHWRRFNDNIFYDRKCAEHKIMEFFQNICNNGCKMDIQGGYWFINSKMVICQDVVGINQRADKYK